MLLKTRIRTPEENPQRVWHVDLQHSYEITVFIFSNLWSFGQVQRGEALNFHTIAGFEHVQRKFGF
jgi:hypothetical protein